MKKKLFVLSGIFFGLAPLVALAQLSTAGSATSCSNPGINNGTLFSVLCTVGSILNAIVPVLIALGVVFFIWGVVSYVIASDEEAKTAGRNRIIYGIIGLAVIVAVWGLVALLTKTFSVNNSGTITLPTVPTGIGQ